MPVAMQLSPKFEATVNLLRSWPFGDYFADLLNNITSGPDWYLLANDFESYIQAQVCHAVAIRVGCLNRVVICC